MSIISFDVNKLKKDSEEGKQLEKFYEAWKAKKFSLKGFDFTIAPVTFDEARDVTVFFDEISRTEGISFFKKPDFENVIKPLILDHVLYKELQISKIKDKELTFFEKYPFLYLPFFSIAIGIFSSPLLVGDNQNSSSL